MTHDELKKWRTDPTGRPAIIADASRRAGEIAAKKVFDKRSRGDSRNVEVHIDEHTLAALCAVVYEAGLKAGLAVHE